ncbi:Rrp46p [Sugiyamaella lignohabitans]|uniref:Rrp46p n=1 Tax=Sugiyamaella lignohabitans TaxID=796027 RepID=A0A167EK80_9ASCO|nr:Rrp46p [Sugiyamaella lignohabitans]ANB14174.1 Rrp46p [Sugiyamaella lignohabitans]
MTVTSTKPIASTGILPSVDGSAEWNYGQTKVICSVSGPMEVKIRDEIPNATTLELVVRPVAGLSTTRETLIEDRLYCALSSVVLRHIHPRSLVQIVVQVMEAGESSKFVCRELAASINSSNLALVDAGVPLQGLVVATSIAILNDDKHSLIVEPSHQDLEASVSSHVVAYEFVDKEPQRLLLCESTGQFSEEEVYEVLERALEGCNTVYQSVRGTLEQKVSKDFVWR